MRYNELQFSGSLMIFEFVKEFYSEQMRYNIFLITMKQNILN